MTVRDLLLILGIAMVTSVSAANAQQCIPASAAGGTGQLPTELSIPTNDLVMNRRTGLLWMRCSAGQQWHDKENTCIGEARAMSWREAHRYASEMGQGWRLPTIHELSAITDLRCHDPAVDLSLFPNTPPSHYWTDTAFILQPEHYWLVQFSTGENHTDSGKKLAHVRLVKND